MTKLEERIEKFFTSCTIADAHCDTLLDLADEKRKFRKKSLTGHLDLPRMEEGRVALQFFAAFIGSEYKPERALKRAINLIDTFFKEIVDYESEVILGRNYRQIMRAMEKGKKVAILALEGGEALAGELATLRIFHRLGVRSIGLTWNQRNELADGVWEGATAGGLTRFGKAVVREMNRLGIIVDLAHISEAGFWDALNTSEKPVMVSHANCRALCDHPRNLSNEQIKAIADQDGLIGLTFAPEFLGGEMTIDSFLNHVDHVSALVGTNYIAIGSDFDGIDSGPKGLEDVTRMPALAVALLEKGYTVEEVKNIMGINLLNFLKKTI